GPGGCVEVLVPRIALARIPCRLEPAVVTPFGDRAADRGPVVVTKKQFGVNTLVATPPALGHHVFHVNAGDPGPVDLDPLLGKSRVVDVADIEVNAHRGAVHLVEKLPELARADEKPLLGVAVLAPDPDA